MYTYIYTNEDAVESREDRCAAALLTGQRDGSWQAQSSSCIASQTDRRLRARLGYRYISILIHARETTARRLVLLRCEEYKGAAFSGFGLLFGILGRAKGFSRAYKFTCVITLSFCQADNVSPTICLFIK